MKGGLAHSVGPGAGLTRSSTSVAWSIKQKVGHPNHLSMKDSDSPSRTILNAPARKRSMRRASLICLADETNRPLDHNAGYCET